MQFVRRVRTIWSWLPAFRAVAESEHLPTAAQELHVVPSSLSRTVKLLEDELGVALFDRTANSLALNDAGRRLLAATREAMRLIDESLAQASGDEMRGTITGVAARDLAVTVLPLACAALANRFPDLAASTLIEDEAAIPAMLRRGDADVAVVATKLDTTDLIVTEVASWSRSVYVGAGRTVDSGGMRCVVVGTPDKVEDDGWPTRLDRQLAMWASDERAALEIVARTGLATIAFDAVVRATTMSEHVVRLPSPRITPRAIYVLTRRAVGTHRRTEALAAAIRESLASLTG